MTIWLCVLGENHRFQTRKRLPMHLNLFFYFYPKPNDIVTVSSSFSRWHFKFCPCDLKVLSMAILSLLPCKTKLLFIKSGIWEVGSDLGLRLRLRSDLGRKTWGFIHLSKTIKEIFSAVQCVKMTTYARSLTSRLRSWHRDKFLYQNFWCFETEILNSFWIPVGFARLGWWPLFSFNLKNIPSFLISDFFVSLFLF